MYRELRVALRQQILGARTLPLDSAGQPVLDLEGRGYKPVPGQSYIRESLLPSDATPVSIGPNALVRHTLLYQLSVFVPAAQGTLTGEIILESLMQQFWPGLSLPVAGGSHLIVRKTNPGPRLQDPDWWHLPLTIRFIYDTTNPA